MFLPGCPDANYPGGGPFDPLGYSKDAPGYVEQQVGQDPRVVGAGRRGSALAHVQGCGPGAEGGAAALPQIATSTRTAPPPPPPPPPPPLQQVKEIKNGRLAMLAFLGYFAQAAATRQGPLQNLLDFARDPAHNNVFALLAQ